MLIAVLDHFLISGSTRESLHSVKNFIKPYDSIQFIGDRTDFADSWYFWGATLYIAADSSYGKQKILDDTKISAGEAG